MWTSFVIYMKNMYSIINITIACSWLKLQCCGAGTCRLCYTVRKFIWWRYIYCFACSMWRNFQSFSSIWLKFTSYRDLNRVTSQIQRNPPKLFEQPLFLGWDWLQICTLKIFSRSTVLYFYQPSHTIKGFFAPNSSAFKSDSFSALIEKLNLKVTVHLFPQDNLL